jgi:hypothetical protein
MQLMRRGWRISILMRYIRISFSWGIGKNPQILLIAALLSGRDTRGNLPDFPNFGNGLVLAIYRRTFRKCNADDQSTD